MMRILGFSIISPAMCVCQDTNLSVQQQINKQKQAVFGTSSKINNYIINIKSFFLNQHNQTEIKCES